MVKCLLCRKEFVSNVILGRHLNRDHATKWKQYQEKFNLGKRCPTCNALLTNQNKMGYCVHHYNRHQEGLGMCGKKRSEEAKRKGRMSLKEWWSDEDHRIRMKQSEETKKKRAEALKRAHIKDPGLGKRQTRGFPNTKGKTWEEKYGKDKAQEMKKTQSARLRGTKQSEEHKRKIGVGNKGKIVSKESRRKMSGTRKKRIQSGKIKISFRVGIGKGGYREDIGHYVRSTYEHRFAQFLNQNKLPYLYEANNFWLNDGLGGMVFTPDFYVNYLWLEIKNTYNVSAPIFKKKLALFKKQYPNEKIYVIIGGKECVESWQIMSDQTDLVKIKVKLEPLAVIKGDRGDKLIEIGARNGS